MKHHTATIDDLAISPSANNSTRPRQHIHEDLRIQHPEWIGPNGDCPTCDSYESRLAELTRT